MAAHSITLRCIGSSSVPLEILDRLRIELRRLDTTLAAPLLGHEVPHRFELAVAEESIPGLELARALRVRDDSRAPVQVQDIDSETMGALRMQQFGRLSRILLALFPDGYARRGEGRRLGDRTAMLSVLIASAVAALFWGTGWVACYFGRRHDEPERKIRRVARTFFMIGLAFGVFTLFVDRSQRRVTLFEEVLACEPGGAHHRVEFTVEHPGAPHSLLLAPNPGSWKSASAPCEVQVRWIDPQGRTLLADGGTLERIRPSGRIATGRWVWDHVERSVVPAVAGLHRVEFVVVAPDAAEVLLRVEDPLKTDGVRARGY